MKKPTDLEGVNPALHIEPDELYPRVHALRHNDGDHVVDPEQWDQHQGGAGQLPAKQTLISYIQESNVLPVIKRYTSRIYTSMHKEFKNSV